MELKSAGKKAREIFDRKLWKIVSYICLSFFPLFCYFLMEMMKKPAIMIRPMTVRKTGKKFFPRRF